MALNWWNSLSRSLNPGTAKSACDHTTPFSFLRTYRLFHTEARFSSRTGMPKKSNKTSKAADSGVEGHGATSGADGTGPVVANSNNTVTIRVLAKPGAKQNAITDIGEEGVGIQIAAPPVEGEANTELVRFLSKTLGLRKSDVTLDKGSKSRNKRIVVTGMTKEEVNDKLRDQIDR